MRTHEKTSIKEKMLLIIFGLFLCVVLLETGLRIGGFILLSRQEYRNRTPLKQKETYRILCLGESTTAHGGENSYPRQMERILNQRNTGIKFKVINKGVSGTTSTSIVAKLENNIKMYDPDIIITMMGLNDTKNTVAFEDIPFQKTPLFLKSFRTYKLAKLLKLHIIHKIEEYQLELFRAKRNIYRDQEGSDGLEEQLKKAMEINPENDEEPVWYRYATIRNYQRLKETVTKKGVKLVCMQYPIVSVAPLKRIFESEENLVFVDNEKIFNEAVARENYDEYFLDRIGDDFGHCTVKGDKLLAENAANVILEEFFGK